MLPRAMSPREMALKRGPPGAEASAIGAATPAHLAMRGRAASMARRGGLGRWRCPRRGARACGGFRVLG